VSGWLRATRAELTPAWRRATTAWATLLVALRLVIALVSGVWLALAQALDGFARELAEGWSAIGGTAREPPASRLARWSHEPAGAVGGGLAWVARGLARGTGWHLRQVERIDRWAGARRRAGESIGG
jgi:hypothetical protein